MSDRRREKKAMPIAFRATETQAGYVIRRHTETGRSVGHFMRKAIILLALYETGRLVRVPADSIFSGPERRGKKIRVEQSHTNGFHDTEWPL